jgi:hypothetical protein
VWWNLGFISECWNQRAVKAVDTYKMKKFKQRSARRLTATIFWDRKWMLMAEFTQQGTTVTSLVYWETLKKVHVSIQNKSRRRPTLGVALIPDNTYLHTHTAACTQSLLGHFNWELFEHFPHNPDIAPMSTTCRTGCVVHTVSHARPLLATTVLTSEF